MAKKSLLSRVRGVVEKVPAPRMIKDALTTVMDTAEHATEAITGKRTVSVTSPREIRANAKAGVNAAGEKVFKVKRGQKHHHHRG